MSKSTKKVLPEFTEKDFWKIIEDAWAKFPAASKMRLNLDDYGSKTLVEMEVILKYFVLPEIKKTLYSLDKEALAIFHQLSRIRAKQLDRWDVHCYASSSYKNTFFLEVGAFIVAMGQDFYELIYSPKKAKIKSYNYRPPVD